MGIILSLIGFALPSLIVRLFFRKNRSGLGIFQDLFVGAQIGTLSLVSLWLVLPIQLLIFYDGVKGRINSPGNDRINSPVGTANRWSKN